MDNGHDPFEEPERGERSHEKDAKFHAGRKPSGEAYLERDNNDPLDLEPNDPEWSDTPAIRTAAEKPRPGRLHQDPAPDKATTTTNNQMGRN